MARNDDGEFELMVGNRQLLTIVFIIFVLCGIVFTMGYFVGRNSGPPVSASAGKAAEQPVRTVAQEQQAGTEQLAPGEAKVEVPPAAQAQSQPVTPPEEAARPAAQPAPAAQRTPSAPPKEREEEAAPEAGGLREPVPGQIYVQVAAVARSMAETTADVLRKKGFPAFVAKGPNTLLFRVFVGPVKDTAAAAKMKSDIQAVGFPSPIVVRK